ncbi:hypothetical protein ACFONC_01915 [Luteimonas soli]|uniref:Tetratricopeptide repeat protein n=1 Tax=Luteimonas soli TaxID=1648966 RepID=A0ABV7XFM0_9GAMM
MTSTNRRFLLASLVCALLAGLLLLPGLSGSFIFDDESNIVRNPAVHLDRLDMESLYQVFFGLQPGGITRILPTLSFAFDHWRGDGLHPSVFKTTNLVIHALTTFALAWFFRTLLLATAIPPARAQLAALALALAWAAHPLQASSVLYVVQRMQTMCTLFLVLALLAYLRARLAQIEGRSGRTGWLLALLLGALALGCKEDAVLLPAYTLAMELTVLGFSAAQPELARALRRGYLLAVVAGAAAFLLVVVPHYWHWDAYPGREFSSWERLLTQGRILCMYMGQILLPLPRNMPFYYDWIEPSRGLLQPWTTLPSVLLVLALLGAAWRQRVRRPLFALGVFVFFSGHFITSNVLNLELAFEHRNHLPLIGALLAIGDLIAFAMQRFKAYSTPAIATCVLLLGFLAVASHARARLWGDPMALAQASTELAPRSARAWNSLAQMYLDRGGGHMPDNPYLGNAIDACEKGAVAAPYSISCLTNLLVYKTLQGSVDQNDWDRYLKRLQHVAMGPQNRQTMQTLINNVSHGVPLDEGGVLKAIEIVAQRGQLRSNEFAAVGYFILTETHQPDLAYPYFVRAVQTTTDPTFSKGLIEDLRKRGRPDWTSKLQTLEKP